MQTRKLQSIALQQVLPLIIGKNGHYAQADVAVVISSKVSPISAGAVRLVQTDKALVFRAVGMTVDKKIALAVWVVPTTTAEQWLKYTVSLGGLRIYLGKRSPPTIAQCTDLFLAILYYCSCPYCFPFACCCFYCIALIFTLLFQMWRG